MGHEADVDRVLEWLIGTCWRVKALLDSGHLDRDELHAQMDSAIRVADQLRAGMVSQGNEISVNMGE